MTRVGLSVPCGPFKYPKDTKVGKRRRKSSKARKNYKNDASRIKHSGTNNNFIRCRSRLKGSEGNCKPDEN